jgi:hypothetical protein
LGGNKYEGKSIFAWAMGGPSVMIWGCFSFFKKSKLSKIEASVNSVSYQNTLYDYLLSYINEHNFLNLIFNSIMPNLIIEFYKNLVFG